MTDEQMVEAFFVYEYLPEHLQESSMPFCIMARQIVHGGFPANTERTVAFRKLLEAKDAAVRCVVFGDSPEATEREVG